jgi:hypothetical protein
MLASIVMPERNGAWRAREVGGVDGTPTDGVEGGCEALGVVKAVSLGG